MSGLKSLYICAVLVMTASAAVSDTRLETLETTQSGRGWEAVGRLDIAGKGFCSGALIAPDLVLTAAHCLFDRATGTPVQHDRIVFLAGWRNGRAEAHRKVRRAVIHPAYAYGRNVTAERVRTDIALLELRQSVRNGKVHPYGIAQRARGGEDVGVVSYGHDRAEAPSLQEMCMVLARQDGIVFLSCDVEKGSSGAPVFTMEDGQPRIVSVISARAEVEGRTVALGAPVAGSLRDLQAALAAGGGFQYGPAPRQTRQNPQAPRRDIGARFLRAGGS